jgi:hypothetical protein
MFDLKPAVIARGKLLNYYAISTGERLYHAGRDIRFEGWVVPGEAGHTLYIMWQKRVSNAWMKVATRAVTIPAGGVVDVRISGNSLRLGSQYRIRCAFKTGPTYLGDISAWAHFRITD